MRKLALSDAHTRHQRAVAAYLAAAAAIPADQWHEQLSAGKWSAAEITAHLVLGFHAVASELRGGPAMHRRLNGWKLLYVRWKYLRRILADGVFPSGARAPRETRPTAGAAAQPEALDRFRSAARECEQLMAERDGVRPRAAVTHPYFGRLSLAQALFVSAKHIEHHLGQLASERNR